MRRQHKLLSGTSLHATGYVVEALQDLPDAITLDEGVEATVGTGSTRAAYTVGVLNGVKEWLVKSTGSGLTPVYHNDDYLATLPINFHGGLVTEKNSLVDVSLSSSGIILDYIERLLTNTNYETVDQDMTLALEEQDRVYVSPAYFGEGDWAQSVFDVYIDGFPLDERKNWMFYPRAQTLYFLAPQPDLVGMMFWGTTEEYQVEVMKMQSPLDDIPLVVCSTDPRLQEVLDAQLLINGSSANNIAVPVVFDASRQAGSIYTEFVAESMDLSLVMDVAGSVVLSADQSPSRDEFGEIILDGEGQIVWQEGFSGYRIDITDEVFFETVDSVVADGVVIDDFSFSDGEITFTVSIRATALVVTGTTSSGYPITWQSATNGSVDAVTVPSVLQSVNGSMGRNISQVDELIWPEGYWYDWPPQTQYYNDSIYLGFTYPKYEDYATLVIHGITEDGCEAYYYYYHYYGNGFTIPSTADYVTKVGPVSQAGTFSDHALPVIFDHSTQRCWLTGPLSGQLTLSARMSTYKGLAVGGEVLEIVDSAPGLFATTDGTGEDPYTIQTSQYEIARYDYTLPVSQQSGIYFQDEDGVIIYMDSNTEYKLNMAAGYTHPLLQPVSVKLPSPSYWAELPRTDRALLGVQFAVSDDFDRFSSTYFSLDDTTRVAESTVAPGKRIILSAADAAHRGKRGVVVNGPDPVFYAGSIGKNAFISLAKFFTATVIDTGGNTLLSTGQTVLLCVSTLQFSGQSLSVRCTPASDAVAADIFPIIEVL